MAGPIDKSGIIEFFLIEAGEHLQNLNKGLLSLEKDPTNTGMIDELFRAAHTLKGSAAMMGFTGVSAVAHKTEDMLDQFRSGTIPICKETLNFLFDSVDAVKLMVDCVASSQPEDQLVVDAITRGYKDVVEAFQKAEIASTQSMAPHKDDLDLAWEKTFEKESGESPVTGPERETPAMSQKSAVSQKQTPPSEAVPLARTRGGQEERHPRKTRRRTPCFGRCCRSGKAVYPRQYRPA